MTPTEEQQLLLAEAKSPHSLMIQAYAGCGKTTSLVLLAAALPAVPSLALAFNKKTATELAERFPKHFEVKTLNGLGHTAWGRAIGKRLTLDDKKLGKLIGEVAKGPDGKGPSSDDWSYILGTVQAAMQAGLVPPGFAAKGLVDNDQDSWAEIATDKHGYSNAQLNALAEQVLTLSIRQGIAGTINFDDQIYLSALFGGVFPKFPIVMVDEAQDLSPLNHIQLAKCSPQNGRLIVVGDKHQAIYAFRGADSASMAKIRTLKSDWVDLNLSLTFRCPKIVVTRQHHHVPKFQAHQSNYDGLFHSITRPTDNLTDEPFWSWQDIQLIANAHSAKNFALLCRNNAPLFKTAFRLIRQGVGCMMLGRDIGKSLSALAKKIIPDPTTGPADCIKLITAWVDNEVAMARANDRDDKADAAHDRGYCLIAVVESAPNVRNREDLLVALERLFARKDELVVLSTIHRSKGLEWDLVIHLDPWRVPKKGAEGVQLEQEMNLKYVCETRAKRVLVTANAEDLKRS
jgi:hypothetical protein